MFFHPTQTHRIIQAIPPVYMTASTGDYVSLKNVSKAWIIANVRGLSAQAITVAPYQAVAVAGTAAKAVSTGFTYWYSNDMNADETLTQTEGTAASVALGASTGYKQLVIAVNAAMFDTAGSTAFDVLGVQVSGGSTDDTISVDYLLEMRYQESDTPATITD